MSSFERVVALSRDGAYSKLDHPPDYFCSTISLASFSLLNPKCLTVGVSGLWVGVDNAWEQEKPEARKMLENREDSHKSTARCVGQLHEWTLFCRKGNTLYVPYSRTPKNGSGCVDSSYMNIANWLASVTSSSFQVAMSLFNCGNKSV